MGTLVQMMAVLAYASENKAINALEMILLSVSRLAETIFLLLMRLVIMVTKELDAAAHVRLSKDIRV